MIPTLIDGVVIPGTSQGGNVHLRFVRVYDIVATGYGRFSAYTEFKISGWLADFKVVNTKADEFIDLGLEEPLATSRITSYWLGDTDKIFLCFKTMSDEAERVAIELGGR